MTPELLRAWETRYGIPTPERTAGGLRVYPEAELERVRAMRELVDGGMAPADAARSVAGAPAPQSAGFGPLRTELEARLDAFDDAGAQSVLDQLLASFSAEVVVGDVILPALERLGDRWARGEVTIAQEHFASTLLRGRMLALGRGWDRGIGPRAVLACPPGELHDLGLIAFGLSLRTHGWRITYLGQDTPIDTVAGTVAALDPAALVLAATDPERLEPIAAELEAMPTKVFVGGRGAVGAATSLPGNPADAAREVVRAHRG
jgi:methanogenic corrinoid protein MtbC1